MPTLIEQIASAQEKVEQLKRRKKAEERREQEHNRKTNTRRNIIVGEIFSKHFPDILILTPRRTITENSVEFAPLDDFLSTLFADEYWRMLLKKKVTQQVNLIPPLKCDG